MQQAVFARARTSHNEIGLRMRTSPECTLRLRCQETKGPRPSELRLVCLNGKCASRKS